jgi:hypothetical protein
MRLLDLTNYVRSSLSYYISMVREVGEPYSTYFLGSYSMPNLQIHATLASMFDGTPEEVRAKRNLDLADFTLLHATVAFMLVIREQNILFGLSLDADIESCERDVLEIWQPRKATNAPEKVPTPTGPSEP